MKVLVLGGYGLIGEAVLERLVEDGHELVGLGRNIGPARRRKPGVQWIAADMSRLLTAADWFPLLAGVEAVVNAAGALQDGPRDRLDAIHRGSVAALVVACERIGVRRLVQISAIGAELASENAFFRTKAEGDAAVSASSLDWTILRPGLVIAPAAYGGTALLRALAAVPGFVPAVLADRPIQTVSVSDVAEAVSRAAAGRLPHMQVIDLVEERARPLSAILLAFRAWLGMPEAPVVALPAAVGRAGGLVADGLGMLGWRSPLRSAALAALDRGVTGDAAIWTGIAGRPPRPLEATLAAMPAHLQERWFARFWLLKPVMFLVLSVFWLASGIVGFVRWEAAADVLVSRGFPANLAPLAVIAGSAADMLVGAAVLVRPLAARALMAMMAITFFYLAAATLFASDLWFDPLGRLVKALPTLCLALVALAVLDER